MKNIRLCVLFCLCAIAQRSFAQVPVLSSYEQAEAVLLLDFDGQLVEGTNWNFNGPLHCGPAKMNEAQITEIFQRVAEDFRPFNINVTTDSTLYEKAPITRRMRVIFTITSSWYGMAGGVAYTNSFTWGNNTPCFVFTALHKYNVKNIAEAASHEAGHTLGLRHQASYDSTCRKTSEYNNGKGSGITGWAPIMGVGYYRNNTTWHFGPNPYGCANEQDDLAIITSEKNGFGYRNDDVANDFDSSIAINKDTVTLDASGIISTGNDIDLFQFSMPASGPVNILVQPYSIRKNDEGSNLDVALKLYDKNKKLIAAYDVDSTLHATLDTSLPYGKYYLAISGTSAIFDSNYASIGAYTVSGNVPYPKTLLPEAYHLLGNIVQDAHQLRWSIDSDVPLLKQILQASSDGKYFDDIAILQPEQRSYMHEGLKNMQYRLKLYFEDGKSYESNSVALQSSITVSKPVLSNTFIHSNNIEIKSPSVYAYRLTDINGRLMQQGRVSQGNNVLQMATPQKGVFVITFEKGSQRVAQKFIRQ